MKDSLALAAVVAAGLVVVPAASAAPAGRKPIAAAGAKLTAGAVDQGAAAKSAAQTLRVYLAPKGGEDALKAAVDAVSTPGSATYGQFISPGEFRARYQPDPATIKAVKQW